MENQILNNINDLMDFVEETRRGSYSTDSLDLENIVHYTIKREEIAYIDEIENNAHSAILYGLY